MHDHYLFLKKTSTSFFPMLVYVDDILLTGPYEFVILKVERFLHVVFIIKDLGYVKYFFDLEMARGSAGELRLMNSFVQIIVHSLASPLDPQ